MVCNIFDARASASIVYAEIFANPEIFSFSKPNSLVKKGMWFRVIFVLQKSLGAYSVLRKLRITV